MRFLLTRYGPIPIQEIDTPKFPAQPQIKLHNYLPELLDPVPDKHCSAIDIFFDDSIATIPFVELSKQDLEEIHFAKIKGSRHKISLPRFIDSKLSYLTGYLVGDGGFKDVYRSRKISGKFEYKIIAGDEFESQITCNIAPLFLDIFNLRTPVRSRIPFGERLYYVNPTSKLVYRFFTEVMGLTAGPKKELKIPDLIKESPDLLRWFIRGVMDADGGVKTIESGAKPSNSCIRLKMADETFIKEMQNALRDAFSLNLTGPYTDRNREWYIQCARTEAIKAYQREIFLHPIKRWRLRELVKKMGGERFELSTPPSSAVCSP